MSPGPTTCDFKSGDAVVYIPDHGAREDGVVTSTNALYVFVRFSVYGTSKAVDPIYLIHAGKTLDIDPRHLESGDR